MLIIFVNKLTFEWEVEEVVEVVVVVFEGWTHWFFEFKWIELESERVAVTLAFDELTLVVKS